MPELDPSLVASLVAARTAIDAALANLARQQQPAQSGGLTDPQGKPLASPPPPPPPKKCAHKNRSRTFGGHWKCLDCGQEGRQVYEEAL